MKLRSKILMVLAAVTVLCAGPVTVFSTLNARSQAKQNEEIKLQQVVSLLRNSVSGQYYNSLNLQINTVFSIRRQLASQAAILNSLVSNLAASDEAVRHLLEQQQQSLSQAGFDLALMYDNSLILPPLDLNVLQAKSLGNLGLISVLRSVHDNHNPGYCQTLYQEPGLLHNYLSYTFALSADPRYTVSILYNIDHILELYDSGNFSAADGLKVNFTELDAVLQGAALIVSADDGRVLLSSASSSLNALAKEFFKDLRLESGLQMLHFQSRNKQRYEICATYFKPLNWHIVALRNYDEIVLPAWQQALVIGSIGAAVLLVSLICSAILAGRITRRLNLVAKQAALISQSNLNEDGTAQALTAKLPQQGDDEVSALSRALNTMGEKLQQNIQNLVETSTQKNRLQGELNAARRIQLGMLPTDDDLPKSAGLQIAGFLNPAKEVGGDFYDAFPIGERLIALTIGDVSDKGVPAALFMSMTMTLSRAVLSLGVEPAKMMEELNLQLSLRNPNMMFVTMFACIIDALTGQYTAVNAGHCPPLVYRDGKVLQLDKISGPAAGAVPDVPYTQYSGTLEKGQCMLLYTDGVSEAQNENLEFFESGRIISLCKDPKFSDLEPKQCIDKVLCAVKEFRGSEVQTDDITMLCIKRPEQLDVCRT